MNVLSVNQQVKEYEFDQSAQNPSAMDLTGICSNCLGFYVVNILFNFYLVVEMKLH
jgi:hypothetical protein